MSGFHIGYILAYDTQLNLILTMPLLGNTTGWDTSIAIDSQYRLYTMNNQLMDVTW
jgi:hypothetical protein